MRNNLRVMIVGQGGREHALYGHIRRSPLVERTFVAPGNAGIPAKNQLPVPDTNFEELTRVAKANGVNFIFVGPEQPIVKGIVDHFAKKAPEIKVCAPNRLGAELEGSKIFTKTRCVRWGIPTAEFDFAGSYPVAERIIKKGGYRVIKADGLCGGKGVVIANSEQEALSAARSFLVEKSQGTAGNSVLLEERLEGKEVSVFALCDGTSVLMLPTARDYKRLKSGPDRPDNPNTGGMGAYSPLSDVTDELLVEIKETIVDKLVAGMNAEDRPYRGVLYAGIMLTEHGPMLIEVNCRFGDPEAQALLVRLESDLVPLLLATCEPDGLAMVEAPRWSAQHAVCVVLAPPGYPRKSNVPLKIEGLERAARRSSVKVFHADTVRGEFGIYTAHGRSLNVVGVGPTLDRARFRAYVGASDISFSHGWPQYREDIADVTE